MEHGPIGPAEAHMMITALSGTPMVPLDLGAMGVCFPIA